MNRKLEIVRELAEQGLLKQFMGFTGFTEADLHTMNRYALEAAFVSETKKNILLTAFDKN